MNTPTQTVERSLHINAPLKRVFDYIADAANLPKVWAGMLEIQDIYKQPSGGRRFNWACRMQGVRFEGEAETVAYTPFERITDHYRGGINRTIEWSFAPENGGTRVIIRLEYHIPAPLLPKHDVGTIIAENIQVVETSLIKLKAMVEDGAGMEFHPAKLYKEV
jgi:uncharacterized membrane protein